MLRDRKIFKVSISPHTDARYLYEDYFCEVAYNPLNNQRNHIRSTLDLRFVAKIARCDYAELAKMSEKYLRISIDQYSNIRYSNWNDEPLSDEQISYAEKKSAD